MNKFIVTTSIYKPTKATMKFIAMKDWKLIMVGDKKTPHEEYVELAKQDKMIYLSPEYQDSKYHDLSESIGWNKIQRRTLGFIEAYNQGADLIATVDDDNIPYDDWGRNVLVGQTVLVDCYQSENGFFDPLSVTNLDFYWHRGYPIDKVKTKNNIKYLGKVERKVMIQADLWDGDPDIDAIERIVWNPLNKFNINEPFCSINVSPFNSQNTFLHREVIPYYIMLPFVGRMDDIWPSYIIQKFFPQSLIYNKATVYQERNQQDLFRNLEHEVFGYRNTSKFLDDIDNFEKYLPEDALKAFQEYRKLFGGA